MSCGCAERREKIKTVATEIGETAMRLFAALGGERKPNSPPPTTGDAT